MLKELIQKWPVIKQLQTGDVHCTGENAMSDQTRQLGPKLQGCQVARSICPYCGVGCGMLIYHKENRMVAIEGDPASPISRGHLCPKGADTLQLHMHPGRLKTVKYRAPFSREWVDIDLEQAMDMIADRMWRTRERTFQEKDDNGDTVMHTLGMAHLGGATLDNEENYLIKKLFAAGLGMNCISNQARI
jgi:formate dehydrogenase major subunit